jgi:pSer/pThr/pTyr-binding forkhead associated (FHA) protein
MMSEYYLLVDASGNATEITGETKIGRSKTNDLVLTDPLASRHHATVFYEGETLKIRDEQSVNGTIVNRGQIYDPVVLNDRDTIQFGDEIFTVRAPLTEAATIRKADAPEVVAPVTKKDVDRSAPPKPESSKIPEEQSNVPENPDTEEKKSSNRNMIIIAGVAVVVLCLCCIVSIVVMNSLGLMDVFGI